MNYSKQNRGISLIEIIIVIGLFGVVASLGTFVSITDFQNNSFRDERDLLVIALEHARALAMHNICEGICTDGKAHGVHIETNAGVISQFIIFQGTLYNKNNPSNIIIEVGKNFSKIITLTGPTDIYFQQLSGSADPTTFTLSDNLTHSSIVSINDEGQISWTN